MIGSLGGPNHLRAITLTPSSTFTVDLPCGLSNNSALVRHVPPRPPTLHGPSTRVHCYDRPRPMAGCTSLPAVHQCVREAVRKARADELRMNSRDICSLSSNLFYELGANFREHPRMEVRRTSENFSSTHLDESRQSKDRECSSWALQRGLVDPVATPNSSLPSSLPLSPCVLTTEEAAGVRLRVVTGNPYSDIARPSSG